MTLNRNVQQVRNTCPPFDRLQFPARPDYLTPLKRSSHFDLKDFHPPPLACGPTPIATIYLPSVAISG